MKKNLAVFCFTMFSCCCCVTVHAQSKTSMIRTDMLKSSEGLKKDSTQIRQEQVKEFMGQVAKNISVTDFQQWCYKKMTAEKYEEFVKAYQAFLQQKFQEWVQQKKK